MNNFTRKHEKKTGRLMLYLALVIVLSLLLQACGKSEERQMPDEPPVEPIKPININEIEKYQGSHAGDVPAMSGIARELPHEYDQLEIRKQHVTVKFKGIGDDGKIFPENEQEWRKMALAAAVLYFMVPEDVETVTVQLLEDEVPPITMEKETFLEWLSSKKIDPDGSVGQIYEQVVTDENAEDYFSQFGE